MRTTTFALGALLLAACAPQAQTPAPAAAPEASVALGRHLVLIGGCNDCHTPGYAESNGAAPAEAMWLAGAPVGYRGPWGVSFPSNLRLTVDGMSEDDWAASLKTRVGLPPMPWASLRAMDEVELRSLYRYIKSLGPAGQTVPGAIPPGAPINAPSFYFVPLAPGERSPQ